MIERDNASPGADRPDAGAPSDPIGRLAHFLFADQSYSHQQAEIELPDYVGDDLLGRPVGDLYPDLHAHLLDCQECFALYRELLRDLDPMEELQSVAVAAPDLSFLPKVESFLDRLRLFVTQATGAILQELDPPSLADLALVAEVFFVRIGDRVDEVALRPAPQAAFGFAGTPPVALRYLIASLVATRRLGKEFSREQLASLRAGSSLAAEVQKRALRAAFDVDLGRQAAGFAAEYTRWVVSQVERFPVDE